MSTIQYHKLIRDRIPEIIESSGKTRTIGTLSDEDYLRTVDAKLDKALAEYHKEQNIEELAELLEVIYAAAKARGYSLEQLEAVRAEKAKKRGAFDKKILLKSVCDPQSGSDLCDLICQNEMEIMRRFDHKMMEKYRWLQEGLHQRTVATDSEYQRKFSGYYKMRFVSQNYRAAFFSLFEDMKNEKELSFADISKALYPVDQKHELSFISKMLHTIDPHRPIYDSQVCEVLKLQRNFSHDIELKISQDQNVLSRISEVYREMDDSAQIKKLLTKIDGLTPGYQMTNEKKYDFLLWALGSILKKR